MGTLRAPSGDPRRFSSEYGIAISETQDESRLSITAEELRIDTYMAVGHAATRWLARDSGELMRWDYSVLQAGGCQWLVAGVVILAVIRSREPSSKITVLRHPGGCQSWFVEPWYLQKARDRRIFGFLNNAAHLLAKLLLYIDCIPDVGCWSYDLRWRLPLSNPAMMYTGTLARLRCSASLFKPRKQWNRPPAINSRSLFAVQSGRKQRRVAAPMGSVVYLSKTMGAAN